jgi:hypothetical protein
MNSNSQRFFSAPLRLCGQISCTVCFVLLFAESLHAQANAPRAYQETLEVLTKALLSVQNQDAKNADFGGLQDPETGLYYSRAAEAVFPFAVMHKRVSERTGERAGDKRWLRASIALGNWLLRQQKPTGEWVEDPWTWTGTTADQLLMMSAALPIVAEHLTNDERKAWKAGISKSADYLVKVMSPDFASINYVPTSAAALAVTWKNIEQRPEWQQKAKTLAYQTIAKMDDDLFIEGEAARYFTAKYGVDIGYQADMSLWGLALYAKIFADETVWNLARQSLANIVHFVYPNGALDGSWGARCYKWTGYGSKTADGCTVLFALFAGENAMYQTAALRNLEYLKTAIKDGFVGYGKHIWGIPGKKANLYPTFARAKTLAMALEWGFHASTSPPIPADEPNWVKVFPTVNVGVVRVGEWMATISAYNYQDRDNWGQGKYHHFPRGGALCNVHLDGLGWLTTSSQTLYRRGEYVHMPEIADTIQCLTPRIEYSDKNGYFTNLYDSHARLRVELTNTGAEATVRGELCDSLARPSGIAFGYDYAFASKTLTKSIALRYHDALASVRVVEPIVLEEGVKVEKIDNNTVKISSPRKTVFMRLSANNPNAVTLSVGDNADKYWFPFPGLRCYPIVMTVKQPANGFQQQFSYSFEVQ